MLKSGIRKADSSLDRLRKLQVTNYQYKSKYRHQMGLDQRRQTGFLAHEVQEFFPGLTREVAQPLYSPEEIAAGAEETFMKFTGVNYVGFIPHLTQAVQEQQDQIEAQQLKIEKQQDELDELRAMNHELLNRLTRLENRLADNATQPSTTILPLSGAQLHQNAPNPFHKQTRIGYFIPEQTQRASLEISDLSGRILKNILIDARGAGQVELEAYALSAGQYTYRLILDGQSIAVRQMVISN
jgi:flagellar biosynthesis chaperone FliJ